MFKALFYFDLNFFLKILNFNEKQLKICAINLVTMKFFMRFFFSLCFLFSPTVVLAYAGICHSPVQMAALMSKPPKKGPSLKKLRSAMRRLNNRKDKKERAIEQAVEDLAGSLDKEKLKDKPSDVAEQIRDYIGTQQDGWDCDDYSSSRLGEKLDKYMAQRPGGDYMLSSPAKSALFQSSLFFSPVLFKILTPALVWAEGLLLGAGKGDSDRKASGETSHSELEGKCKSSGGKWLLDKPTKKRYCECHPKILNKEGRCVSKEQQCLSQNGRWLPGGIGTGGECIYPAQIKCKQSGGNWNNNRCVCYGSKGLERKNGYCVKTEQRKKCERSGGTFKQGQCQCKQGTELTNQGTCQAMTLPAEDHTEKIAECNRKNQILPKGKTKCESCPKNHIQRENVCKACTDEEWVVSNKCKPLKCPEGLIPFDGECRLCPKNKISRDKKCVPCPNGQIVKQNKCVSKDSALDHDGTSNGEATAESSKTDNKSACEDKSGTWVENHGCCPFGYNQKKEQCNVSRTECQNGGQVWNQKTKTCCEKGQKLEGDNCVASNTCPSWKDSGAFGPNGRVRDSFCKDYASDKRACSRALKRLKKRIESLNKLDENLSKLEDEYDSARSSSLKDLESDTEAGGLCFSCLKRFLKSSEPTAGETIGNLLKTVTGAGIGLIGYNMGQRAQYDANMLRLNQGYAPQNDYYSLIGASAGIPFVASGLYGMTRTSTPQGGWACSPTMSPYGHVHNYQYGQGYTMPYY